ncbi:hypothetical protein ACFL54_05815 [Planctomycetota bacterium]
MNGNDDIGDVISKIQEEQPAIICEHRNIKQSGYDDDNIWTFRLPGQKDMVQIESPNGNPPFVVDSEKYSRQVICHTVDGTVSTIIRWLRTTPDEERGGK